MPRDVSLSVSKCWNGGLKTYAKYLPRRHWPMIKTRRRGVRNRSPALGLWRRNCAGVGSPRIKKKSLLVDSQKIKKLIHFWFSLNIKKIIIKNIIKYKNIIQYHNQNYLINIKTYWKKTVNIFWRRR